jgi:hypothetical protein
MENHAFMADCNEQQELHLKSLSKIASLKKKKLCFVLQLMQAASISLPMASAYFTMMPIVICLCTN